MSEIDKEVFGETEQTQQAIVESVRGTITRIDEDKIYDLTEEEVKIIADIIENGTWNTEGTAECANDCKLIIDERIYYYHSECGTFNDKENNQNLPVTAEEKESINVILAQYVTLGLEKKKKKTRGGGLSSCPPRPLAAHPERAALCADAALSRHSAL